MAKRRPLSPLTDILTSIKNETDRGCVIVSAAWMDDRLRTLIEALLRATESHSLNRPPEKTRESLLQHLMSGCLESAMNRADFCRCVGIIDNRMHEALRALFQLRNKHFGHFAGVSKLGDGPASILLKQFFEATLFDSGSQAIDRGSRDKSQPIGVTLYKVPWVGKFKSKRHSKTRQQFMLRLLMLFIKLSNVSVPLVGIIPDFDEFGLRCQSKS